VPTFGPRMVCTNCGIVGAHARVRAARRSYVSRPRKARSTLALPGRLRTDQVVTDHALAPAFAPRGARVFGARR
jgi:hypothetical protein